MGRAQAGLPRERGVDEADGVAGREHDVADAAARRPGGIRAQPPLVEQPVAREDPRVVAQRVLGRDEELLGRTVARMQVAEPCVAGVGVDHAVERAEPDPRLLPEVDLTVVGGDEERDVVGQHVAERADEAIGGLELAGVEAAFEAERVRDLVDARVIRVHEGRAAGDQRAHVLDQHRGGGPAVEVGARGGAHR